MAAVNVAIVGATGAVGQEFLTVLADIFPLKYFIDLVAAISLEGEQIWEQPVEVAVIAAWGVAGTAFALRRFRWVPREG